MKLKKMLNLHEEATNLRLRSVCQAYNALVCPKVRLADVFPIERSGISSDLYRFALKAHFDFVITTSQYDPLFAVEYDGPGHSYESQSSLDQMKNTLCKNFEFPILRIDSRYLPNRYGERSLLAWLVEVYFLKRRWQHGQEEGHIPPDESFWPFNPVVRPNGDVILMRLAVYAERTIHKLYKLGKCVSPFVPRLTGKAPDGQWKALAGVQVTKETYAYAEAQIQGQLFPVQFDDLIDELVLLKVQKALMRTLRGEVPPLSRTEFQQRAIQFRQQYQVWTGFLI